VPLFKRGGRGSPLLRRGRGKSPIGKEEGCPPARRRKNVLQLDSRMQRKKWSVLGKGKGLERRRRVVYGRRGSNAKNDPKKEASDMNRKGRCPGRYYPAVDETSLPRKGRERKNDYGGGKRRSLSYGKKERIKRRCHVRQYKNTLLLAPMKEEEDKGKGGKKGVSILQERRGGKE